MKFLGKLVVAVCLATGIGMAAQVTPVRAALSQCSTMKVYESAYSKCTAGVTGQQRVTAVCVVNGSTQQFVVHGAWTGRNTWSVAHCPTMMRLVNMWYSLSG